MHELSLSHALVETALEALADTCHEGINCLVVEIGELAGIEPEALSFCFPIAAQGTPLDGAVLRIERLPVRVRCATCGAEESLPDPLHLRCPRCGRPTGDILGGREIQLKSIELRVRDEPASTQPEVAGDPARRETHEHHPHPGTAA